MSSSSLPPSLHFASSTLQQEIHLSVAMQTAATLLGVGMLCFFFDVVFAYVIVWALYAISAQQDNRAGQAALVLCAALFLSTTAVAVYVLWTSGRRRRRPDETSRLSQDRTDSCAAEGGSDSRSLFSISTTTLQSNISGPT